MDDSKIITKNKKRTGPETLMKTMGIWSQVEGMEFGIEKCALLIMKSCKGETTEGIELLNHESIRMLVEKKTSKAWEY